ncbi:MAG: hypothetical protein ABSE54_02195 [Smithella sp.]|jgi:hypothetical protein
MTVDINPILEEILISGKTVGIIDDKENIQRFITKEINGDDLIAYLVIGANLSKDRDGVLVYLLTSAKIVKIEIDKEQVQSFSSYLKEVTGVNRTLLNNPSGNSARIVVEFLQGSFGLRYSAGDEIIDSFFQKVDEAVRKIKGATTDGN